MFLDYAGVDLTEHWHWNNHDEKTVRDLLNRYLKLRGDVVHRARVVSPGPPSAHPVKKEDLKKAIRFLKELVQATERAFQPRET